MKTRVALALVLAAACTSPPETPPFAATSVGRESGERGPLRDLSERWERTPAGLEQLLTLRAPPPGSGDVLIHLSSNRFAYEGAAGAALRFRDTRTGKAFSFGDAFALVHEGHVALAMRAAGDGLDIVIPEALAQDGSAWPLVIDPVFTALDASPVPTAAFGPQLHPALAVFGDAGYLAAWTDQREPVSQIYLMPVSNDVSTVNSTYSIRATYGQTNARDPALACNGSGSLCVLAWVQEVAPMTPQVQYELIVSGIPQDPVVLNSNAVSTRSPAVTFDSNRFFIAYVIEGSPTRIGGAWVTGPPASATLVAIDGGTHDIDKPSVAAAGINDIVVAWQTASPALSISGVHLTQVDPPVLIPAASFGSSIGSPPAIAYDGAHYAIVWTTPAPMADVMGIRLGFDAGMTVLADQYAKTLVPLQGDANDPAVAGPIAGVGGVSFAYTKDGGVYGAHWLQTGGIITSLLTSQGTYPQGHAALACGAPSCMLAQEALFKPGFDVDIYAAKDVGQNSDLLVSIAANTQFRPRVAASDDGFMVVDRDNRVNNRFQLYGYVLDSSGVRLVPPILLTSEMAAADEPAIASDGTSYLVVWSGRDPILQSTSVQALHVDGAGVVRDMSPIIIDTQGSHSPAVTSSAGGYTVVWVAQRGTPSQIIATVVSSGGGPGQMNVAYSPLPQSWPAVASAQNVTLVAWVETTGSTVQSDVLVRRIDQNLGAIDVMPVPVDNAADVNTRPAVGTDGTDFLVAWTDATGHVRVSNVAALDGMVDPASITLGIGEPPLSVTYDGNSYIVTWQVPAPDGGARTVQQVALNSTATVTPIPNASAADVAFMSTGAGLMTIERFDPNLNVPRAMIAPLGDGGITYTVICDAGTLGMVGVPYSFDDSRRLETLPPDVPRVSFGPCPGSTNLTDGLFIEATTGSVSWVPTTAAHYSFCVQASVQDGAPKRCYFGVDVADAGAGGPTAIADAGPNPGTVNKNIVFSGLGSGGSPVTYQWDFGDMSPLAYGTTLKHQYNLPGGYQAELTVRDAYGREDVVKLPVRVKDTQGNVPPLARIDESLHQSDQRHDFECSSCNNLTLFWEIAGDGGFIAQGDKVSQTFRPGRYRVRLRAVDTASGLAGNDQKMVEVDDLMNRAPPSCHGWVTPTAEPVPGMQFQFGVDDLQNPSGTISTLEYWFDGGAQMLGKKVLRPATVPGLERGDLVVIASSGLPCFDNVYAVGLGTVSSAMPPRFDDVSAPAAACGVAYLFKPMIEGAQPLTVTLSSPLPGGADVDPATGSVKWTPPVGTSGVVALVLRAQNDAGEGDVTLPITVTCPDALDFQSCGCGYGASGPLLVLLAAWLRRRRA